MREKIISNLRETMEDVSLTGKASGDQVDDILAFIQSMTYHHEDQLKSEKKHVLDTCFQSYGEFIDENEKNDIKQLNDARRRLEGMERNLDRELDDCDENEHDLKQQRERVKAGRTAHTGD